MINWEIKKILKSKSFIVSVVLFIFIILSMSILKPILGMENNSNNEYVVDEKSEEIIGCEKLTNKVNKLKELSELKDLNIKEENIKKMSEIAEEELKKDNGKEYKNINFYRVFNFRIANGVTSIMITIILIILLSNIYTEEKVSNVDTIILSSKNRNKALYSKLILSIIIPIVIYGLYLLIIGVITAIQYGAPINGELQAYRLVYIPYMLRYSFTINEYTAIAIITMVLLYTIISVFSSFCSFITNNSISSVVGSTIILIVFKVAMLIKLLPENILKVLQKTNFIDLYMQPEMFIGTYQGNISILGSSVDLIRLSYVVLCALLTIGIICNIYAFKRL